jgi:hypothetical protein
VPSGGAVGINPAPLAAPAPAMAAPVQGPTDEELGRAVRTLIRALLST